MECDGVLVASWDRHSQLIGPSGDSPFVSFTLNCSILEIPCIGYPYWEREWQEEGKGPWTRTPASPSQCQLWLLLWYWTSCLVSFWLITPSSMCFLFSLLCYLLRSSTIFLLGFKIILLLCKRALHIKEVSIRWILHIFSPLASSFILKSS